MKISFFHFIEAHPNKIHVGWNPWNLLFIFNGEIWNILEKKSPNKLFREIRKRRTLAESKTKDRSGKDGRYCSKAIEELGWWRYIHYFFIQHAAEVICCERRYKKGFFLRFFALKQNKVNSKNWGETNFDMSKKQKDVRDVFFKIKGRMTVIEISIISPCTSCTHL